MSASSLHCWRKQFFKLQPNSFWYFLWKSWFLSCCSCSPNDSLFLSRPLSLCLLPSRSSFSLLWPYLCAPRTCSLPLLVYLVPAPRPLVCPYLCPFPHHHLSLYASALRVFPATFPVLSVTPVIPALPSLLGALKSRPLPAMLSLSTCWQTPRLWLLQPLSVSAWPLCHLQAQHPQGLSTQPLTN